MVRSCRTISLRSHCLENLSDWFACMHDFVKQELEKEDLFKRGFEFYQADLDIDHAQVFLAIEMLA